MQVARRFIVVAIATCALAVGLALTAWKLHRLRAEHAELARLESQVCMMRESTLVMLTLPHEVPKWDYGKEAAQLMDTSICELCLGTAYPLEWDKANWCWIMSGDDRKRAAHCFDETFVDLLNLYRRHDNEWLGALRGD